MKKLLLTICFILLCLTTSAWAVEQKTVPAQDKLPDIPPISLKESLPELNKVIGNMPEIVKMVSRYAAFIFKPDYLTAENHLKAIFQLRDAVIKAIDEPVTVYISQAEQKQISTDKLIDELKSLGMKGVYIEGMFAALTTAPILEGKISKIASEAFKLYFQLMQHYANSLGGEYPYLNLTEKMKVLEIGEQLRKKYPGNEYIKDSHDVFADALRTLTDVHKLSSKQYTQYIIGSVTAEFYPSGTDIENYNKFVAEYPQSQFNNVVRRILANMSEIKVNEEGGFDRMYLVVTDEVRDFKMGEDIVFKYLSNGADIPHLIQSKQNSHLITYRFYSDKTKADQALGIIKKSNPAARIVMMDSVPVQ